MLVAQFRFVRVIRLQPLPDDERPHPPDSERCAPVLPIAGVVLPVPETTVVAAIFLQAPVSTARAEHQRFPVAGEPTLRAVCIYRQVDRVERYYRLDLAVHNGFFPDPFPAQRFPPYPAQTVVRRRPVLLVASCEYRRTRLLLFAVTARRVVAVVSHRKMRGNREHQPTASSLQQPPASNRQIGESPRLGRQDHALRNDQPR